jgi:hypothetical protein
MRSRLFSLGKYNRLKIKCIPELPHGACSFLDNRTGRHILKNMVDASNADTRNQNPSVLSRHSGMPLAGIHPSASLDSGLNHAGMTER